MTDTRETAAAHLNNALTLARLSDPHTIDEAKETIASMEARIARALEMLPASPAVTRFWPFSEQGEPVPSTRGDIHEGCGGIWGAPSDAHDSGLIDRCSKCGEERA